MDTQKRILFVDNELQSIYGAIECLNDAGYTTHFADNSTDAWKLLNEGSYDAVILNQCMYCGEGSELLHKIKETPKLAKIPIIIETSAEGSADHLAALEAGAADFIYKPLEKDFLLYVVENIVDDDHSERLT